MIKIKNLSSEITCQKTSILSVINRPGVAGAYLQTPSSLLMTLLMTLTDSFINSLFHPFPPNLQDIINLKLLELGS